MQLNFLGSYILLEVKFSRVFSPGNFSEGNKVLRKSKFLDRELHIIGS